jgi:transcriptional regulator GlxA family with amidase domain
MRLEHAHTLVTQTSMPVIEIAISAGYESLNYFSQKFKQVFEYSPAQLRKNKTSLALENSQLNQNNG